MNYERLLLALMMLCVTGCASTQYGVSTTTQTVLGLEIQSAPETVVPSVRLGLIRHELVRVSTNAVAGNEIIKATSAENRGWTRGRVHTVFALGSNAVTQDTAAKHMPSTETSGTEK